VGLTKKGKGVFKTRGEREKGEKGKRVKKPGLSFVPNFTGEAQGNNRAEDFV
jgi:hypothetical protein